MFNSKIVFVNILSFLVAETIAIFIFLLVRKKYAKKLNEASINQSIIKGFIERLVLFCGLMANYQSILIVFGTLKIATRIKDDQNEKISNDYFIVGNFLSILVVFLALLFSFIGLKIV